MITELTAADRDRWAELWTGYLAFYKTTLPAEIYDHTWASIGNGRIHARGARDGAGRLIGITHFFYHASAWSIAPVCYLQDLFVSEEARGTGAGRKLIEAVAAAAKEAGSPRLYWMTQEGNATARLLYDRLARQTDFIRYDYVWPS